MTTEIFMVNGDQDLQIVWGLLMKGAIFLMLIGVALGGCHYLNERAGLDQDHPLEEFLEDVAEFHLGLERDTLDFTPEKP